MKHIFTLLFFLAGLAATAQTIAVQGVLRDPRGRTVDDGFYEVVFSIYDQQADGTALWSETHPSLATKNGLFVAKLGTYQTLDIAFDTTYYLGIAIEGRVEISPRMELSLAPYALGVFGAENYFPGVGDVRIKDSLSIVEGSLTLAEGNMKLGRGNLALDSGNLTMQGGDIILNKAGAGIEFADGTKLTTAFGGTAANLSNPNSVIIAADTDEDGVGSIDLKIGDSTHVQINNAGRVSVRKDLLLDSGQLVAKTGNDLGFGHWNPADSTYSEVMKMQADGRVVFSGNVKAAGTATADEDLVNLGTLNSYLAPNIPDTIQVPYEAPIGSQLGGGTVFANEGGYTYIAYEYNAGSSISFYSSGPYIPTTSTAFGQGETNTQNLLAIVNVGGLLSAVQGEINGFSDWWVPSRDELQRVFDFTDLGTDGNYYHTSSQDGCTSSYRILSPDGNSSCAFSVQRAIVVRKVPAERDVIQYDDNSTLTVGALQNYLPVFTEDPVQPIGSDFGGGKVFANDNDYVYVAFPFFNSSYQLNSNNTSFTSSTEFGSGYDNTQIIFGNENDGNGNGWEYYIQNNAPGGYTDWYIPSQGEYDSIFMNYPQIMGSNTGITLWTSTSLSNGSTNARTAYFSSSSSYSSNSNYFSQSNYYHTILIRRIARNKTYTADDNDFVTVGFLLNKIAELEAQINALLAPGVGESAGGGTVFKVEGDYTYIAVEVSTSANNPYNDYSTNTNLTYGDHSDWYTPSEAELSTVFSETSVATTSNYYWTNASGCSGSSYYTLLNAAGNTTCDWQANNHGLIYVRAVLTSSL